MVLSCYITLNHTCNALLHLCLCDYGVSIVKCPRVALFLLLMLPVCPTTEKNIDNAFLLLHYEGAIFVIIHIAEKHKK